MSCLFWNPFRSRTTKTAPPINDEKGLQQNDGKDSRDQACLEIVVTGGFHDRAHCNPGQLWDSDGPTMSLPRAGLLQCPDLEFSLAHLNLSHNSLSVLPELPPGLINLNISYNRFDKIPKISKCPELRMLKADANDIVVVDGVFPSSLVTIDLSYNIIQDVQSVFPPGANVSLSYNFLFHISDTLLQSWHGGTTVTLDHNEFDSTPRPRPGLGTFVPPDMTRDKCIARYRQITGTPSTGTSSTGGTGRTIYDDTENAHDAVVQRSAMASISIIKQKSLERKSHWTIERCKEALSKEEPQLAGNLEEWCSLTRPHSVYDISFSTLLCRVMEVIELIEHPNEGLRRLCEELVESRKLCFGGRMVRCVNALTGLVPGVDIKVPTSSSLNSGILHIMKEARKTGASQGDISLMCRVQAEDLLTCHGITNAIEREAYLEHFHHDDEPSSTTPTP
jgi:hypothetical protein